MGRREREGEKKRRGEGRGGEGRGGDIQYSYFLWLLASSTHAEGRHVLKNKIEILIITWT